jgi:predicted RNA-binding Zn ribbon-like protein
VSPSLGVSNYLNSIDGDVTVQLRLMVMSKQQEAPGELELVRAFVNTIDIEAATEEIAEPADLAGWLERHGLAAPPLKAGSADVGHAVELREALRAVLLAHNGGADAPTGATAALERTARRARIALHFDEHGGAQLEPEATGVDAGLGRLLTIVQRAIAEGTWLRLKACREHGCEWAFYDHTKNRSGAWCTMAVCGNRAKARSYRERRSDVARRG